jgi:transcriptional regulator with XRE-family HTH domain
VDFSRVAKLIGQNVRRARWLRGLTQEQLASRGFTYRYLQEIERGVRNPSLRTLADIADALDVPLSELVDLGQPRMNPPLRRRRVAPPPRGRRPRAR